MPEVYITTFSGSAFRVAPLFLLLRDSAIHTRDFPLHLYSLPKQLPSGLETTLNT